MKSYPLLYTVKGEGVLNYMGSKYEIKEKSTVFIDCTKLHEYFPVTDNWEFKFIHFSGEQSKKYYEYITKLYNTAVINNTDDFERYFDTIYNFVKLSEGEERCSDIIYRLLTKLISNYNKIS